MTAASGTFWRRALLILIGLALALGLGWQFLWPLLFGAYTGTANAPLSFPNSQPLPEPQFERLVLELTEPARRARAEALAAAATDPPAPDSRPLLNTPSFLADAGYAHIRYFRDAGIRQYEGPRTCLTCHPTTRIVRPDGRVAEVDTLHDLVNSVHFKFQSTAAGFSTVGYDGRQVNAPGQRRIPVGKINRGCGIPGSFSWTGWAALIESRPEHDGQPASGPVLRSEGCGQCHIGGNYHPATEKMMPVGDVPAMAKEGIDCLICHAAAYDMNQRYVLKDATGLRWNQDRSLRAALTVGRPESRNCLFCHQHNLGGDAYPDNHAAQALGERNPRLLHAGAKRGNPFGPADDVHAAAGMQCTDCHVPEGHKIPRGQKGVDLVANDLPGKVVSCERCHGQEPHGRSEDSALLNGHTARIACETCHIRRLQDTNVVLRDWVHPTWNAEEGVWEPTDIYRSGEPGKGLIYLWFNGSGTFLANALGSHPDGGDYDPLMRQVARITDPAVVAAVRQAAEVLKTRYPDIDVDAYVRAATEPLSQLSPELLARRRAMIDANLRAAMAQGESRIYPFKPFNALMYEDLNNQGPFGAMILPFDYATYQGSGDSAAAVVAAMAHPIMRRMYQAPFKYYMMDEFMAYFGVEQGWNTTYPIIGGPRAPQLGPQVQPRWMRQMGTLMVNHGIQRQGHTCQDCHRKDGLLDFAALGYPPERIAELETLELTAPPPA